MSMINSCTARRTVSQTRHIATLPCPWSTTRVRSACRAERVHAPRLFIMSLRVPLFLTLLAAALAAEDAHAGHDHGGDGGFEWAGIFPSPDKFYLWTAQSKMVRFAHAC